jgi:double-stranded uracil-DNA glycosylase
MMYRKELPDPAWKPTREEIEAARGRAVPDVIAHNLKVLFVGINPGLYSGATGHHFARPGNRFWPLLHAAGFTPRIVNPYEEKRLLDLGYGITNIVDRSTASAREVSAEELKEGGRRLKEKVHQFHPRFVAVLGIDAYRKAFSRPKASAGPQEEGIDQAIAWVLPNPSGANANYQFPDLVRLFTEFREAVVKGQKGCPPDAALL